MTAEIDKKTDSRWWEFYFVRYFVGTAIGAIVILFLAHAESPVLTYQGEIATILKTLKTTNFDSGYITVLATIGLAFCYLASAPILVLHATRGSLFKLRNHFNWKFISMFTFLTIAISSAQSYVLWLSLKVKGNPWQNFTFYEGSFLLLIVSIIFLGQLFLLWLSLFGKEKDAFEYYDKLVKKRALADEAGKEYIESYKHLREHGNAFFITLLELLLGATMYYSPVPWSMLLIFWIFPAAGVWFFGSFLEKRNF